MKLAIIADDLTGANDSGVQLAKYGLKTSVLFDLDKKGIHGKEAVIFDTDSRSISPQEAYDYTYKIADFLKENGFSHIYKKIDSTMRGNLGAEIDAVYEVMQPDFMLIVPGYPKNNRIVKNGCHYLNGQPLHRTEIAQDPKTPVTESYIPELLAGQTDKEIGTITKDVLEAGEEEVISFLTQYKEAGVPYIVVDAEVEDDLKDILLFTKAHDFLIGWVGSAGLANYLPSYYDIQKKETNFAIQPDNRRKVLTVVGSVNVNSRNQLAEAKKNEQTKSIAFDSWKAVADEKIKQAELTRVYEKVVKAVSEDYHVIVYSTGEAKDVEKAREEGLTQGLNHTEVSNEIVNALGELTAKLLDENLFEGIVMTGGDTAKQICQHLSIKGFELFDELETGIPLGTFVDYKNIYTVTKAGGFGSENVFINSILKLQGENTK